MNNHDLPDGNKRCPSVSMVVFLRRNQVEWRAPSADDAVTTMVAVSSKHLDVAALAAWTRSHTTDREAATRGSQFSVPLRSLIDTQSTEKGVSR